MLFSTYYAQNNAGIIGQGLWLGLDRLPRAPPTPLHAVCSEPLPLVNCNGTTFDGFCFTTVQYSHFIFAWGFLMLVLLTLLIHIMSTYFLSQRVYMYTSQWCYFNNWSGIPMIQSNLTTLTCDTSLSIHFRLQWISHNGKLLAVESTPAGIPSGGMLMLIGRQHMSLLTTLTRTLDINLFCS